MQERLLATGSAAGVREGLSTVTRGTLLVLIGTLGLIGLTFVSRVFLIHTISYPEWNAFSFGLTLAALLSSFGTLGLPSAVARSIPYAASDDERRAFVRGSLWIGGGAAIASGLLLWLFSGPIGTILGDPVIGFGLSIFPIAVACSILASMIVSIFQGFEDVFPNAIFLSIVNPGLFVVFLGVALFLPPFGISYTESLVAYALANVVTLALLAGYAVRRLPRHLPSGPRAPAALGKLLRFAAPLFIVGIMGSISGSGDTLILGVFHSNEVGTYSASLTLARLLQVGVSALGYIFLPVATRFLRQSEPGSILLTYATATKWMILLSLPLFVLFFFLPASSLGFVYGSGYALVIAPLQIAVVGAFVTTLCGPATTAQVVYGQTRLLMVNAVAGGLIDLGLSFLLIPAYGYAGAAVAWAGANVAYTALSLGQVALAYRVHPFSRDFVLPVLATALPIGAALFLLRPALPYLAVPLLGLAIAGLFLLIVLATRSIGEGDRLLLEAVERLIGRPLYLVRRLGRYGLRRTG